MSELEKYCNRDLKNYYWTEDISEVLDKVANTQPYTEPEKEEKKIKIKKQKIKANSIKRDVEEALQEEVDNRDDSIIDTLDYLTYDER